MELLECDECDGTYYEDESDADEPERFCCCECEGTYYNKIEVEEPDDFGE